MFRLKNLLLKSINLLVIVFMFFMGLLASKYHYSPYWEFMGSFLASDYFAVITFYEEDLRVTLEKIKNEEINKNELKDFNHNIFLNYYTVHRMLSEYDSIKRMDSFDVPEYEKFAKDLHDLFLRGGSISYDEENDTVLIKEEKKLTKMLEIAKEIEGIIHHHYPFLKEKEEHNRENVIEAGQELWSDDRTKEEIYFIYPFLEEKEEYNRENVIETGQEFWGDDRKKEVIREINDNIGDIYCPFKY